MARGEVRRRPLGKELHFQTRQNHGELVGVNLRNVSSLFCVIEVK